MTNLREFDKLIEIMKKLRGPNGCPWDLEQTIDSLKPYLIEELYEVLEAMDESSEKHKEELGDLLLQIVFQSQIRSEENKFDINDVVEEINKKLIRRHPHIFGDTKVVDSEEVSKNWDEIKKNEKNNRNRNSILDGIPKNIPALAKALKLQNKAAKVGFDWKTPEGALVKMKEELKELEEGILNKDIENIKEEMGDLIFSIVNVSRLLNIDAYDSLSKTNVKFEKRFRYIEEKVDINNSSLKEMDKFWEEAKNVLKRKD